MMLRRKKVRRMMTRGIILRNRKEVEDHDVG